MDEQLKITKGSHLSEFHKMHETRIGYKGDARIIPLIDNEVD